MDNLCFGVSCAPAIFYRLSNAIVYMMARRGFPAIVNYLDDFLIIGNTYAECQHDVTTLINLLHSLGFNISWKTAVSPSQRITFLGIDYLTIRPCRFACQPTSKIVCTLSSRLSQKKSTRPSVNCNLSRAR